ncbi:hypothetical protein BaRGS_00030967 [Batillaria attramentaria]|uniref:Transmembrane protein n=1 Tax=Batillaria attramentaria TaxID=370345 RepID=A0ABD0JS18_9CAEN
MGRLKMKRWQYRPTSFKVGFCGVLLATVLCCMGLVAPAWQTSGGLWVYSMTSVTRPSRYSAIDLPVPELKGNCQAVCFNPSIPIKRVVSPVDWFQAVRVLELLCVVLLVISITVETFQDACARRPNSSDNSAAELLAIFAGISGLVGVVVFTVKVSDYPEGLGPYGPTRVQLFWAWYLQTAGSLLALLSACLMGWSRAAHRRNTARNMQVAAFWKTAPVSVNPYFVSRSVPSVRIVSTLPKQGDSEV